ncbi:MAG: hypothetical protein ACI364_01725, partial [Coriobacteriales bacterium]
TPAIDSLALSTPALPREATEQKQSPRSFTPVTPPDLEPGEAAAAGLAAVAVRARGHEALGAAPLERFVQAGLVDLDRRPRAAPEGLSWDPVTSQSRILMYHDVGRLPEHLLAHSLSDAPSSVAST